MSLSRYFIWALCLLPTVSFSAVNIDDFSVGPLEMTEESVILQEGLDSSSVIGGNRTLFARALDETSFSARVNTTLNAFSFESSRFGYFTLTYSIDPNSQIDLLASGNTAFLLDFSYVHPDFRRGIYELTVNDVSYDFARELFSIEGPGEVIIPFSEFTDQSTFIPREISLRAARVEPGLRLEISSITAIPEPSITGLLIACFSFFIVRRSRQ